MNLGIVLAVSDYGSPQDNLPGCEADGKAIHSIFKCDDKFDDVLTLSDNTTSGNVKKQLIEFIDKHKNQEVEEVVFYYTGHGDFNGKEFYFLLSDYDQSKTKQTTLENSELDNLLKALSAKVTVKIVDACHSGQAYIKDSDSFDKYLNGTKSNFNKCYFMYSSQLEQYSYQDESLSFFTKSLVDAVKHHSSNLIRYKDIIDYVSDAFESNSEQTPFFVVQADFTESFCNISQSLRETLSSLTDNDTKEAVKENSQFTSIVDRIIADAERYCSEQEAYELFSKFVEEFSGFSFEGELAQLYNCKDKTGDDAPLNPQAIGAWLESSDNKYFAQPTYRNVEKTKRVRNQSRYTSALSTTSLTSLFGDPDDINDDLHFKTVSYMEKEISGYQITIDQPVDLIEVLAEPNYPNISAGKVFIVPILSKTELRVFYSFVHMVDSGWSERVIKQEIKWLTKSVALKNLDYKSLSKSIMQSFSNSLLNPINKTYGIKSADSETDKEET